MPFKGFLSEVKTYYHRSGKTKGRTGSTGAGDRGSLGAGRGVVMLTGAGPGLASGMRVTALLMLFSERSLLPSYP